MARILSQLLSDVNSYVALDPSVPTGSDATTWTNYANQSVLKAASFTNLPQFHVSQLVATSGGPNSLATLASITLVDGFREFEASPKVNLGGGVFQEYSEVRPSDRFGQDSNDPFFYVLGNPAQGYTAIFNRLTANAILCLDYQRFPSGFATLSDECELDDDTFVVEQTKSYILQARSDDRFPTVEANANRLLQNMKGRQDKPLPGGVNTTPKLQTYRIGE